MEASRASFLDLFFFCCKTSYAFCIVCVWKSFFISSCSSASVLPRLTSLTEESMNLDLVSDADLLTALRVEVSD